MKYALLTYGEDETGEGMYLVGLWDSEEATLAAINAAIPTHLTRDEYGTVRLTADPYVIVEVARVHDEEAAPVGLGSEGETIFMRRDDEHTLGFYKED
jgi:hypothetical protein